MIAQQAVTGRRGTRTMLSASAAASRSSRPTARGTFPTSGGGAGAGWQAREVKIVPLSAEHARDAEALVDAALGGRQQARLDEVIDVLDLPGLGSWEDDRLVGLATFALDGTSGEIAALCVAADRRGAGIGGQLIDTTIEAVRSRGVERLWLVTTNDNLVALALYQRHGFRLTELRPGAIDRARAAKPAIPEIGSNGIPMHDELILTRQLR